MAQFMVQFMAQNRCRFVFDLPNRNREKLNIILVISYHERNEADTDFVAGNQPVRCDRYKNRLTAAK